MDTSIKDKIPINSIDMKICIWTSTMESGMEICQDKHGYTKWIRMNDCELTA